MLKGTERGRGGRGRGGRDAAAATEQENRMTPVNVRRPGAVDRRLVVLVVDGLFPIDILIF